MGHDAVTIGLLSDFNVQNLAALLQKKAGPYQIRCAQGPFGQTMSVLLDRNDPFWSAPHDLLVLWTLPERVAGTFGKVLAFEAHSQEALLSEVDAFADLVLRVPETVRTIVIPSWIVPGADRWMGPLDLRNGGVTNALMRMNLRLIDALEQDRRVVIVDSSRWTSAAGEQAFNSTLWYASKTPFHVKVFQEAAADILATIDASRGRSKKIVILDLDDTLWGGVVGDLGWEKVRLGGHDPVGEAYVDFQTALKRLTNRGIILGLASKNEESVALEAIRSHPEMVLKLEDFAGWRINWKDKAENIADLMAELNLGLDAAVFLDDNPFERARVREALPPVFVPDLPAAPIEYPRFLARLTCFDNIAISEEDRSRTKMYVAARARSAQKAETGSLDAWLATLGLKVKVEPLNAVNLDRAAQLLNKTNQMNLSTRRLAPSEFRSWAETDGNAVWTFRVSDRFGDYGLCGIASLVRTAGQARILDFLLSCRVIGRGVEDAMLATLLRHAKASGCSLVTAEYLPTEKNKPVWKWLETVSCTDRQRSSLSFSLADPVSLPHHVEMVFPDALEEVTAVNE